MQFRYHKFSLPRQSAFFGNTILKPIIPITVSYEDKQLRYEALIDSGADFCIFDAQIGSYLGIDVASGIKEVFGGIQERGNAVAFLHKVTINIGGWNYETIVGFSQDIAKYGFAILGQKGFFDLFTVKFDLKKEIIELTPKQN